MDRFGGVRPVSVAAVFRRRSCDSRPDRCMMTTITTVWGSASCSHSYGSVGSRNACSQFVGFREWRFPVL